jgi:hypothetical protein
MLHHEHRLRLVLDVPRFLRELKGIWFTFELDVAPAQIWYHGRIDARRARGGDVLAMSAMRSVPRRRRHVAHA